jgi:hypothetical protein
MYLFYHKSHVLVISRLSTSFHLLSPTKSSSITHEDDGQICGFSNEISEKTFSKNEQLKNLIRKWHKSFLYKKTKKKLRY